MRLSPKRGAILLEHVDRPDGVPVIAFRMQSILALLNNGFLKADFPRRPRITFITETGRAAARKLLARTADKLATRRPHRDRAAYMRRYRDENGRPSRAVGHEHEIAPRRAPRIAREEVHG